VYKKCSYIIYSPRAQSSQKGRQEADWHLLSTFRLECKCKFQEPTKASRPSQRGYETGLPRLNEYHYSCKGMVACKGPVNDCSTIFNRCISPSWKFPYLKSARRHHDTRQLYTHISSPTHPASIPIFLHYFSSFLCSHPPHQPSTFHPHPDAPSRSTNSAAD